MEPTIREATTRDTPMLTRLIRQSHKDVAERFSLTSQNCPTHPSLCTEEWVAAAMSKGFRFYILEFGGVPCGCVALEQTEAGTAQIKRLSVLPAFRRGGLGRRLVRHALEQARTLGANRVEIGVIADYTELKEWYTRMGFTIASDRVVLPHLPFAVTYMTIQTANS